MDRIPIQGTCVAPAAAMDGEKVLRAALEALSDKKALNLCVIDISKVTTVARYFVIASGTSTTHIRALADSVEDRLRKEGAAAYRATGYQSARWILLDYSDVVVHVFHEQERDFYGLERLWRDGEFLPVAMSG